ncbi:hypothetical protein [Williamsia sp. 1135]|uniref:aa3-type cytochrome oxidase subunit CtaJ n=1 Tax=Williamsia sp. 1135 TaxID=1889262 RepID=UPI000A1136C8|nr:hypothetical protein [Williamsia sp. 1135]ORM37046.1 hypothetical protein BFL43_05230 [Williamsia sp. 1135]
MEDLIVAIGMPVIIITIISVVMVIGALVITSGVKYPKVQYYKIDQKWEHGPLLLSATEANPVAPGYHGHGHDDLIGGSASGKW